MNDPDSALPPQSEPDPSPDSSSDPFPPPENQFLSLDPRTISYWRVHSLISSVILLGVATIGGGILLLNVFSAWPYVAAALSALLLLRIFWIWWYPSRSYQAWKYRLDDRVLETQQGILFRTITLLPLSRLQHVDLHRGPMERSFGLATLLMHTAGTQNATIGIPGLSVEEATRLRDQLVAAGGDDAV